MKKTIVTAAAASLIAGGFYVLSTSNGDCVNLHVDYGSIDSQARLTKCISADKNTNALDILAKANLEIEGTKKYKDAVVCRVNGLPDESVEKCETMPPAEAYWAVIIKKRQVVPFPRNEWGWAQKGINETYVSPGDSLGLVFSTDGEVRWP